MLTDFDPYADPAAIFRDLSAAIQSPKRRTVAESASEFLWNDKGRFNPEIAPYMIEPMNCADSRKHNVVCVVGPARGGKTYAIADGWIAHAVTSSPADMGIYFPTKENANDFSVRRLDPMHRYSKAIREQLAPRANADNVFRKRYRSGMLVDLLWPASSQLAQREFTRVMLSDYDAFPQKIGKEGSPFELARKRIQVAMSAGCIIVESSPRFEVIDPDWVPSTLHEAPPVAAGVLPIYNMGDRRRFYWRCLSCGHGFEAPERPRVEMRKDWTAARIAETARVICPACREQFRTEDKKELNNTGLWLADGQEVTREGEIKGRREVNPIASFWFKGCAAAFQSWEEIAFNEVNGQRELESKGTEETLKSKRNIDQGVPFLPVRLKSNRKAADLHQRSEIYDRRIVPDGCKVVTGAVDIQSNRFEVQIQAWAPGFKTWTLDRFAIDIYQAEGADPVPVNPAEELAHWTEIARLVIASKEYVNTDGEIVPVAMCACDSGGAKGVTYRAYEFYRWARMRGLDDRLMLIKGTGKVGAQLMLESWQNKTDPKHYHGATGAVPVQIINTNIGKDEIDSLLESGRIHLPRFASMGFFEQLCAESRDPLGKWIKVKEHAPNETIDLYNYNWFALQKLGVIDWGEDWENCPNWSVLHEIREPEQQRQADRQADRSRPRPRKRRGFGSDSWRSG